MAEPVTETSSLSALRDGDARHHAHGLVCLVVGVSRLPGAVEAEAGGLLRVLLLRRCPLPTEAVAPAGPLEVPELRRHAGHVMVEVVTVEQPSSAGIVGHNVGHKALHVPHGNCVLQNRATQPLPIHLT